MNSFYTVIDFLKNHLIDDQDVNTVIHGVVNDIDISSKKNIYPLAHINVTGASYPTNLISFNFTVNILDQRNISKITSSDKWLRNDNELDNLNTCHAVVSRLIQKLKVNYNDYDIELVNEPSPTPVIYEYTNTLDGWSVEIQLSIPNTICGGKSEC